MFSGFYNDARSSSLIQTKRATASLKQRKSTASSMYQTTFFDIVTLKIWMLRGQKISIRSGLRGKGVKPIKDQRRTRPWWCILCGKRPVLCYRRQFKVKKMHICVYLMSFCIFAMFVHILHIFLEQIFFLCLSGIHSENRWRRSWIWIGCMDTIWSQNWPSTTIKGWSLASYPSRRSNWWRWCLWHQNSDVDWSNEEISDDPPSFRRRRA